MIDTDHLHHEWMELEGFMLSETSQSEKDNDHMVALTGRIEEPAQRIIKERQENGKERHQRGRPTMRCLTIGNK